MLKLASLFSDGAVLQRDLQVPVWGTAEPDTIIHAVCGNAEGYSRSSETGKFTVCLPPMSAGGPFELTVAAGRESVTVHDVLIGEVWLAGGQSNMQYQLNSDWVKRHPENGEDLPGRIQEQEFIESIREPEMVRSILIPRTAKGTVTDIFPGVWRKMNKSNAPDFSAVGAWFAKKVQETLHIPVGIIECNWGGTIAETWTSRNGLVRNPVTAAMLRDSDRYFLSEDAWTTNYIGSPVSSEFIKKNAVKDTGNIGLEKGWNMPDFDDSSWKNMTVPGSWIKQKISGNGAVWVRRSVTIPESWAGKPLVLHLGPVDKHDVTYFNGTEIGRTGKDFEDGFWNMPRNYPVPASLVKGGSVLIAIRAFSFMFDGAVSARFLENTENGEMLPLNGTWKAQGESDSMVVVQTQDPNLKFRRGNPNLPAMLFNSMLHPLIPYGIRGVIWYQGESNANTYEDAENYYQKLHILIDDWRWHWAQGDFPFIQMILAGYRAPASISATDAWPILRDAQIRLSQDMNSVYAASAIDIGEADDIHPQNKKDAGLRMARVALAKVYHIDGVTASGPRLLKYTAEAGRIRLEFENSEGLSFRNSTAKGFFLSNASGNFLLPDSVTIENNAVLLKYNPSVLLKGVYYSWADNPDGNLVNGEGLPADPFHIQFE